MPTCEHKHTRYVRVIGRDGRAQIMEQCRDCLGNARGPGEWVAKTEVGADVATLPVARDLRSPEDRGEQPLLF